MVHHGYLLIPNYPPSQGTVGLKSDIPFSHFVKIVCFFSNYYTHANGQCLQIHTIHVKPKRNCHPKSCVLCVHHFFPPFDRKQSQASLFSMEE